MNTTFCKRFRELRAREKLYLFNFIVNRIIEKWGRNERKKLNCFEEAIRAMRRDTSTVTVMM